MTIVPLMAILTLVTLRIVNILNWIRDHILEMQDDLKELKGISNDIYTQGLRITASTPSWEMAMTSTLDQSSARNKNMAYNEES